MTYTVEPAHAMSKRTIHDGRPTVEELEHWQLHEQVIHYNPFAELPTVPGDASRSNNWKTSAVAYVRVTGFEDWPGWTFDVPVSWDPEVPLPCPDMPMSYSLIKEVDGEFVDDPEPGLPTGWVRHEHNRWEVWHSPPDSPCYPGEEDL